MSIDITWLESIRVIFFLFNFVVMPGFITVSLLFNQDAIRAPHYIPLSIGWSLAVGVLAVYAAQAIDGSIKALTFLVLGFNATGAAVLAARYLHQAAKQPNLSLSIKKPTSFLIVLALVWFGVIFFLGPRVDYSHDAWYHIAHIQEAMEEDKIRPHNAYWPKLELGRAYSLWHAIVAAVANAAQVDTLIVWRAGNAFIAASALLVIYAVAEAVFENPSTALLAGAVFMGVEKQPGAFIYPYGIANTLLWASLGLFFAYQKTRRRELLLSATVIGLLPIFLHPHEYIFLCFAIATCALTALLNVVISRTQRDDFKATILFLALLIVIGLPLLLLNYAEFVQATATAHRVDAQTQHPLARMLTGIFPHGYKFSSFKFKLTPFRAIALLVSTVLFTKPLKNRRSRFLLTLAWAPFLAYIVPGVSYIANLVLRETYTWRLIALIPTPLILAATIRKGAPRMNLSPGSRRGISRYIWMILSGIVVALMVVNLTIKISARQRMKDGPIETDMLSAEPLQTAEMFKALDRATEQPAVILSDPWTSYAIPGMTQHTVVLNMPAHGGRSDLDTRFFETRELLSSPYQSRGEAIHTLEQYDIDFIVVNKPWQEAYFLYATPFYSTYTLAFLRGNPACFQSLYTSKIFEVFEFTGCTPDELLTKGQPKESVALEGIGSLTDIDVNEDLRLRGYSLPRDGHPLRAGSEVTVTLYWEAKHPIREPYWVWLEILCPYPEEDLPYGKAIRTVREELGDVSLATTSVGWVPVPPAGLDAGEVLPQPFQVVVPDNIVAGVCDLNVFTAPRQSAIYTTSLLPELMMEKQYLYAGSTIDRIAIRR